MSRIIRISIILALANGYYQELVKILTPIMDKVVILARKWIAHRPKKDTNIP